jgi:hypothetical protein
MTERTFVAYLILNGHDAGQRCETWPADGKYPPALEHSGHTFFLIDGNLADNEAHYSA